MDALTLSQFYHTAQEDLEAARSAARDMRRMHMHMQMRMRAAGQGAHPIAATSAVFPASPWSSTSPSSSSLPAPTPTVSSDVAEAAPILVAAPTAGDAVPPMFCRVHQLTLDQVFS